MLVWESGGWNWAVAAGARLAWVWGAREEEWCGKRWGEVEDAGKGTWGSGDIPGEIPKGSLLAKQNGSFLSLGELVFSHVKYGGNTFLMMLGWFTPQIFT